MDRLKHLKEQLLASWRGKEKIPLVPPEIPVENESEFIKMLDELDFIGSGGEALVFFTKDKKSVIRFSIYNVSFDALQRIVEQIKRKNSNPSDLENLEMLIDTAGSLPNLIESMRKDEDKRTRRKAAAHNTIYHKDPSITLPVLVMFTIDGQAKALVMPYIDGEPMTSEEADEFDRKKGLESLDANPANYRKNIKNYPYREIRLDIDQIPKSFKV